MSHRHLPVRPRLDQLQQQATDLLRGIASGDAVAIEELREHHPQPVQPASATLDDAQLTLARSYGVGNWPRLVLACRLIDAIWRDDVETIRSMVRDRPALLHEMARGTESCNWGPPMSYAANLGRDRIIDALLDLGVVDLESAFTRATLQSQIGTARKLYETAGRPLMPEDAAMGQAEALSAAGMLLVLELGGAITDGKGDWRRPVALTLETYSRNREDIHKILELMSDNGIQLPDTAPMAVHRGRIDLVERHLHRDPQLLSRTFSRREIFPPELGCGEDDLSGVCGTPLEGASLLHMCVQYDEREIADWLLARGMAADTRAAIDEDGFGAHIPLFTAAVSFSHRVWNKDPTYQGDHFARLLLDRGANPNVRVSLRKRDYDDHVLHEHREITPLAWGQRYHDPRCASESAMRLVAERGGRP
jgi:hypothetical protein